ncbi:MAG: Nif3-like dinuclear metal center hexameric protein [Sphingobacteriaceae bacterium]|nr:Nif3-like dinuclear metal center hexameric protein [Sphingobacteriaceae bacterium]
MTIKNITQVIEEFAPLTYQESYDNCGLLTGDANVACSGVLLTLDCLEETLDEAIQLKANLIVMHHPVIFSGLKKITGDNFIERIIIKAIKNNIALYATHTNIDNVRQGVNYKIAEKLGLENCKILAPKTNLLRKLVTYVPATHHEKVLQALFEAGCGQIGEYENCSFNTSGTGTFKGSDKTNPFIGKAGQLSKEAEIKIETIFEARNEKNILKALKSNHPYEEVAFDVYPLENKLNAVGSGIIAEFKEAMREEDFLKLVQKALKTKVLRHTKMSDKFVKKVAICGGSGRFLLKNAINSKSDAFLTSDFKYHDFFEVEEKLLLVDAGHFETEQYTPEIFYEIITKKFATFAIHLSKINTNPVNYFI